MNKILAIVLTFLITTPFLFAEDVVLVAAKLKIDAYSPKDMSYLGKFADLTEVMKPTCMTISKDGKLIVAGIGLHQSSQKNIIIKLDMDGNVDNMEVLFQQTERNNPIDIPKSIVELDDGSIVLFDDAKNKIFKFSPTGEFLGDFFKEGEKQPDASRINSIFRYYNNVVVAASDPTYKLVEYDSSGVLATNLTIGNEYIRNPFHISKISGGYIMVALALVEVDGVSKQVSTLLQLTPDLLFVKKLISDEDIDKNTLLRPRFALKNEDTGKFLIIDEGRSRINTDSYDDNLELFSSDGKYEKSLGTYQDTLLNHIILFENSTKTWK